MRTGEPLACIDSPLSTGTNAGHVQRQNRQCYLFLVYRAGDIDNISTSLQMVTTSIELFPS